MSHSTRLAVCVTSLTRLSANRSHPVPPRSSVSLVVMVAVDQMRGDYLTRYASQWTGAFARINAQGVVFLNGRQYHATTETAPGHATLLSGREPSHTMIVSNALAVRTQSRPCSGCRWGPALRR